MWQDNNFIYTYNKWYEPSETSLIWVFSTKINTIISLLGSNKKIPVESENSYKTYCKLLVRYFQQNNYE